jgi:hypothetical protein
MDKTVQSYLDIMEEFLQGTRRVDNIPSELEKAFHMNFRGSDHGLCGLKGHIGAGAWREILMLREWKNEILGDLLYLEGVVGGQQVSLRYNTRNRGGSSFCRGSINGKEISPTDATQMTELFLLVRRAQYAIGELPNAFSQIEIAREREAEETRSQLAAVEPLAHLIRARF